MRLVFAGVLAALTAIGLAAVHPPIFTAGEKAAAATVQERQLRADIRFLSSDLLAGRGPATAGDELAQEYIASRFEAIGLEPAGDSGSWRQPFALVSVESRCPKTVVFTRGAQQVRLRFYEDFIAVSGVERDLARIDDAEVVFVGYGITAPEYGWDDFKGVDLRGKVLLVMNNDPETDPELFAGRRRLYYGRWDYKYEQAARRGAAGAIVIHTTPSAGYGWPVVQSSWTGEQFALPAGDEVALEVEAWATEEASRRIASLAGLDLDDLRARAESRDFRPVPLDVRLSLSIPNRVERRHTANVLGRLPGSDPSAREVVLYTAHHDHLGSRPGRDGGQAVVYNGALDNASGVAQMLAIAQAFASLGERPRRSIVFAAVGAEEQGLLGSEYLARHLPVPVGRVAADINTDGINIWGRTRDVAVVGLGKSTLDDWIRAISETQDRTVTAEVFPDHGAYYRSDHLSFARVGVPSASLDTGTHFVGRPEDWGRRAREAWERDRYHQANDDLTPEWDFSGAIEDTQLLFYLGVKVANAPELPQWRPGDEFEPARQRALAELQP